MLSNYLWKWLCLAGALSLVSCVPPEKEPEKKEEEEIKDKLIGRIASIHQKEGYVLVQRYVRLDMDQDAILYTIGENQNSGSLKVTGEKLGQFVAADIVSGNFTLGDAVYLRIFNKKGNQSELSATP